MGKDMELLKAVKEEDIAQVQRIVAKVKAKQKKQGTIKRSLVNHQDEDGFSALHHAALNSNCNIMAALLDCNQISVDIKDNKGMRPLHYAAWQGKVQPVYLLVKFGSAPNDGSQDGETPLHLASQHGSHMVVDTLLQFKANPTLKNKSGKTALDLAAEFGRLKVVQLLMNSNQSTALLDFPSRTRVSMHTPLHVAAKNGHSDVIRVLLEYGIDINRETPNGTALHEAALAGKSEVVKLLIASGIDVYKKNSHGQTALDIVNKFTPTRAAQDIKQLLRESIGGSHARALQDYIRIHDRSALSFKAGDIISILERNPDGKWKGSIAKGNVESIGYFPSSHVELLTRPISTSKSNHSLSLLNQEYLVTFEFIFYYSTTFWNKYLGLLLSSS
ncbi:caskin-2-like [Patiria miniata]|uniref:SH3 domain-containing protein n=1 Tax=Patiria miniata TaxID=46514 RepID=A0A914AK82_PATMI|nr:caskin-2-like [Patiria miniata]XP_038064395.1 caskin-2-like [Patiria miniata]